MCAVNIFLFGLDIWSAQLDGQISQVVGDIQKVESKLAQLKETFERQKVDTKSLQRGQQANSRSLEPKVKIKSCVITGRDFLPLN